VTTKSQTPTVTKKKNREEEMATTMVIPPRGRTVKRTEIPTNKGSKDSKEDE